MILLIIGVLIRIWASFCGVGWIFAPIWLIKIFRNQYAFRIVFGLNWFLSFSSNWVWILNVFEMSWCVRLNGMSFEFSGKFCFEVAVLWNRIREWMDELLFLVTMFCSGPYGAAVLVCSKYSQYDIERLNWWTNFGFEFW